MIIDQMLAQINLWEQAADRRAEFLSCYRLMTENMLAEVDAAAFHDPTWVGALLQHFAGYYFNALNKYESGSSGTPVVWQQAFDAAKDPQTLTIQNLMLGINAHINFDLTFAIVDLLEDEWLSSSTDKHNQRYADHCKVNSVIYATIDAVQDTIIEPKEPVFEVIDELFGPVDEWAISTLVSYWRDEVWEHAVRMLESNPEGRLKTARQIERSAFQRGRLILRVL